MDKEVGLDFLKEKGTVGLEIFSLQQKTACAVAKIPWGEGRTIEEVLAIKKVGTCTGKHLVLQACLDALGIPYTPVVCTFRWGDQPIEYPERLKKMLKEGEWEHGHNFVTIPIGNSKHIDVDVTWDPALEDFGFLSFPKDWDGKTPFIGVKNIIERWEGVDVEGT